MIGEAAVSLRRMELLRCDGECVCKCVLPSAAFWKEEVQKHRSRTKRLRVYFIFRKLGLVGVLDPDSETTSGSGSETIIIVRDPDFTSTSFGFESRSFRYFQYT